jgi:hypothetical protein
VGSNYPLRLVVNVMRFLNWATFGLFGRLLNRLPHEQNVLSSAQKLAHTQGSLGQVFAMRDVGITVGNLRSPVQFVTTHGDKLSGTWPVGGLFRRAGGAAGGNGWFHFGADARVPHAMVSRQQNKAPGAVDRLERMLLEFIETGRVANLHP